MQVGSHATVVAAATLVSLAAGCYPVSPPLMAAAAPIEPHQVSYGGALSGSLTTPGYQPLATPAFEMWLRLPLGEGTDAGLRVAAAGSAMVDVRHRFLDVGRLTLSAALGLGGVVVVEDRISGVTPAPLSGPGLPFAGIAEAPILLGWRRGGATVVVGFRPGLRLLGPSAGVAFDTAGRIALPGLEPVLGAVLGVEIPVAGHATVHLEADAMRSFVNPSTILTVSAGISRH